MAVQPDLRGLFERALDDEPVPPPGDPVGQAMADGRRIRRRRGMLVGGSAAVALVAVLTTLNVALAPAEPPPPAPAVAGVAALVTAPCAERLKRAEQVSVFLSQDITDSQRFNLDAALRADPNVRDLRFETRQQAYTKFVRRWKESPDLVASVTSEALPESFQMDLADPSGYPSFVAKFTKQAGVEQVAGAPCPGAGK